MMDLILGIVAVAVSGFVGALLITLSANIVPSGYVRFIARFGKVHRILEPGLTFTRPFADKPLYLRWMRPITPSRQAARFYSDIKDIPTKNVRHDPPAYRVMIKNDSIKHVDLNFYSKIYEYESAIGSDNLWKNLEDHVETAVINICREYANEDEIFDRLQFDLKSHPEIKGFCQQYGIDLVSVQIQRVLSTEEAIRMREESAAKILRSHAAKAENIAESEALQAKLLTQQTLQEKERTLALSKLECEAAVTLAKLNAEISKEKTERELEAERSKTRIETSKMNIEVVNAAEEGIHGLHYRYLEKLPYEHRARVLESYYLARALKDNKTIKKLTMCSHLPYGNSFFHSTEAAK